MRELGRLNRTETVAVQTNYVLARCGLQVSDAIASDAIANGRFVRVSPRALLYVRRNAASRKVSVRSHASVAAEAS